MAAADVAVVHGGLTTTMELTAARVPFIFVPIQHHFEQNFHVRHRLEQYGAGQCASYAEISDPEWLAEALVKLVGTDVSFRPVEDGGAERAASMLAELI
jgi:UDP-N-acetylglucosamine:LPS N-acetylglucosamine transferase